MGICVLKKEKEKEKEKRLINQEQLINVFSFVCRWYANNTEFVCLCWINSSIKRVQRHRTRQVRTRSHSPTSFFILTTAPTTVPAIF
jgi:hypothetical protein